jgi:acetyl-CoA synthetase
VISHPAVAESAVVGRPDPTKGEAVVIFAILKAAFQPSADLKRELTDHIRMKIGPVATPEEVYFVSRLPKTRSGKIMRRVLKAIATGSSVGDLSTLEDEASVDEVKKAYEELKREI